MGYASRSQIETEVWGWGNAFNTPYERVERRRELPKKKNGMLEFKTQWEPYTVSIVQNDAVKALLGRNEFEGHAPDILFKNFENNTTMILERPATLIYLYKKNKSGNWDIIWRGKFKNRLENFDVFPTSFKSGFALIKDNKNNDANWKILKDQQYFDRAVDLKEYFVKKSNAELNEVIQTLYYSSFDKQESFMNSVEDLILHDRHSTHNKSNSSNHNLDEN